MDDDDEEDSNDDEDEDDDVDDEKEQDEADDDDDGENGEEEDDDDDGFDVTDYITADFGEFEGDGHDDGIDLEEDSVNAAELEKIDEALIAVFREKQKQSASRLNAKKCRIEKRVYHFLLLFVRKYRTSALLLIMLPPLMVCLWQLFERITEEYQSAHNKQMNKAKKKLTAGNIDSDQRQKLKQEIKHIQQSKKEVNAEQHHNAGQGLPAWRYDDSLKRTWEEYLKMLGKPDKHKQVQSTQLKNFHAATSIIEAILQKSPRLMVEADGQQNEIKLEWLKEIIFDIIELLKQSPSYHHENLGAKILSYVCCVYRLKCEQQSNINLMQLWSKLDLNAVDKTSDDMNGDIVWLFNLWYEQLNMFLTQKKRTWYFSTEFFDIFMRRQPFIVWKLVFDAFREFSICRNAWSQSQLFVILGYVSHCGQLHDDKDHKLMEQILKDMAVSVLKAVRECMETPMEVTKKMLIASNTGAFLKKIKKCKLEIKEREEIRACLDASKSQHKKEKQQKKKKAPSKADPQKNETSKSSKTKSQQSASSKQKTKKKSKKKKIQWSKKGGNNSKKRKLSQKKGKANPAKKRKLN